MIPRFFFSTAILCIALLPLSAARAASVCDGKWVPDWVAGQLQALDTKYEELIFKNQEMPRVPSAMVADLVNDYRVYRCRVRTIREEARAMLFGATTGSLHSIAPFGCPAVRFVVPEVCVPNDAAERDKALSAIDTVVFIDIERHRSFLRLSQRIVSDRQESQFFAARLWALNSKMPLLNNDLSSLRAGFVTLGKNIGFTIRQCTTK